MIFITPPMAFPPQREEKGPGTTSILSISSTGMLDQFTPPELALFKGWLSIKTKVLSEPGIPLSTTEFREALGL